MVAKLLRLCLPVALALISLWLVTGALAEGPGAVARGAASSVAAQGLTPTVQLVDADGRLLASPAVYRRLAGDTGPLTLYFSTTLGLAQPLSITIDSFSLLAAGGGPVAASIDISSASQGLPSGEGAIDVMLLDGSLPAGSYTGQISFSIPVSNAAPAAEVPAMGTVTPTTPLSSTEVATGTSPTATAAAPVPASATNTAEFMLLVSNQPAELAWAQTDFTYAIQLTQTRQPIQVSAIARYTDATQVTLTLDSLIGGTGSLAAFQTTAASIPLVRDRLAQNSLTPLTLMVDTGVLPGPGVYTGELRLSADNAAPITATLTLLTPDAVRGAYQLVVGELGTTHGLTGTQPLTSAVQLSGVRLLPFLTQPRRWPPEWLVITVMAVLLIFALWAVVAYARLIGASESDSLVGWSVLAVLVVALAMGWMWGLPPVVVEQRSLGVWEAHGRGPVRDLSAIGSTVVDEQGEEGTVVLVGASPGVTVPVNNLDANSPVSLVTISDVISLTSPGVYQGRLFIQSPSIANGLVEVPVQVNVGDMPLWPALVILLGVIVGGIIKYEAGPAGQRLDKRLALEQARANWDAKLADYGSCGPGGSPNPIFRREFDRIDDAERLLDADSEWGIAGTQETVDAVKADLTKFVALNTALAQMHDKMAHVESAFSKQEIDKVNDRLTKLLAALNDADLHKKLTTDQKQKLIELTGAAQAPLAAQAEALRDEVVVKIAALERDLCDGDLEQAGRRWDEEFVRGLTLALDYWKGQIDKAGSADMTLKGVLAPAKAELDQATETLKPSPNPPTADAVATGWCQLIQARYTMALAIKGRLADLLDSLEKAVTQPQRLTSPVQLQRHLSRAMTALEALQLLPPEKPRVVAEPQQFQFVMESALPHLWQSSIEHKAPNAWYVYCELQVRLKDIDPNAKPDAISVQVGQPGDVCIESNKLHSPATELFNITLEKKVDNKWTGAPESVKIVARYGDRTAPLEFTIESPYQIVLPLHPLVAGETNVVEARWRATVQQPADHAIYEWDVTEAAKPGEAATEINNIKQGKMTTLLLPREESGRHMQIQLSVQTKDEPKTLLQRAYLDQRVQESPFDTLNRDKRRLNLRRQVGAALLALVGGIVANRIFGATFGSVSEYFAAFAWGTAVNVSVDPAIDALTKLPGGVKDLFTSTAKTSRTDSGEPAAKPRKPD